MKRIALATLLLAGPALAEKVTDPRTGLSVDPPPPYRAMIIPPRPPNTVAIGVRSPADRDTGCQVAFRPTPQNERFTQAELNATATSETWRAEAQRSLNTLYTIDHSETFRHAGIEGLMLEGMLRMREGLPARAKDIRTLFVIMETPLGRTSAVCVGDRADFARRRPEFIAVIRSTTPPSPANPRPVALKP